MAYERIAVIGAACVYPGALSVDELWQNVLAGRRFFRKLVPERVPREYHDPDPRAPGKTYCDQMAVITGWRFEPTEFGIPPVVFKTSEISHWLALHVAREALRDAGLDLSRADRTRIGVVLGNSGDEFARSHGLTARWPYVERAVRRAVEKSAPGAEADALVAAIRHYYESPLPAITEDHLAGNMANIVAGRVCNHFDLRGGGYIVDGACASSLLAVAHGSQAIASGDLDVVLAGGVDVSLDPFELVGFAKTQALAKDDIRPYDARAAGMITGEGAGMVVLAREDFARREGHRARAFVRGWGVSSDGGGGITAPKVEGQMLALRRAYQRAGYSISTVGLIEGHGTGTALGDKVEITALRNVMEESEGRSSARIGSIKGNIGHTKAAAGMAGLLKAILAVDRKVVPPTVSCSVPNPAFGKPLTNLRPALEGGPWRNGDGPRRASVSAMGFGGVNAHVTIEEASPGEPSAADLALLGSQQQSELVLLSADGERDLADRVAKLLPIADRICRADLIDLAAALASRPAGPVRLAVVAESPWHLAQALRSAQEKLAAGAGVEALDDPGRGVLAGRARPAPKVAALFPGQASQRLNMGEAFRRRYPFVRERLAALDEACGPVVGAALSGIVQRDLLAADDATRARWAAELRETRVQQPAVVAASLAAADVLAFLGIAPDYALGHSLGEITALAVAGAFDPPTAVKVAALRGRAMTTVAAADPGGMVALAAPPERAEEILRRLGLALVVANLNSPRQTVLSGPTSAVEALLGACEREGVRGTRLDVSHAFHSDLVAPAAAVLRAGLDLVEVARPERCAVFSSATGGRLAPEADLPELLADHVRRPVRFSEALRALAAEEPALWIEVGPGQVLSALARDNLGAVPAFPMDLEDEDAFHLLNRLAGRAFTLGVNFAPARLFAHRLVRPLDPERYEPVLLVNPAERAVPPLAAAPALGSVALAELVPAELRGANGTLAGYLRSRGAFIRDVVALDFRHQMGPGGEPTAAAATPAAPEPTPAPRASGEPEAPAGNLDDAAALALAVDWIANRTGFPKDFITPDKRLRDDLNLDSIKGAELVLTLSQAIGKGAPLDPGALANATVVELVREVRGSEAARAPEAGAVVTSWIRTLAVERLDAPLASERALPALGAGRVAVLGSAGCPRAEAVAARLRAGGAEVSALTAEAYLEAGGPAPEALVLVVPEERRRFDECDLAAWEARAPALAERLFRVFRKALAKRIGAGELTALVVRPSGPPGADPGADLDAGAALLKTLSQEHRGASFKWIGVPAAWAPDRVAEAVLGELGSRSDRVEFHYDSDGRRTSPAAIAATLPAPGSGPKLGGTDAVLVSGGAKGITFELALELARKTGVKLALLGTSPAPDPRSGSADEVSRNLERLGRAGVRHAYVQCDVTRPEDVRRAVVAAERRLGPVTGILHGAGVSRFAVFLEMELESFMRCVRVKADGLYNLLGAVDRDRLKLVHVTSSVLGRTGMQRQADYAFANAWLDGAVRSLAEASPALHAVSVGWSMWEETGMGVKTGALDALRTIGVTAIPVSTGTAAYLDLLGRAAPSAPLVVTGKLTTDIEARLFAALEVPPWRFLERTLRFVPGLEIVAECRLSHATDLYLAEHVFERTPVFPGVMAMEAMAQGAMACAGRREPPVLRDVRFRKPVIVPEGAEVRLRIYALAEPPAGGETRVRVSMRSERDGFQAEHFSAECGFEAQPSTAERAPPAPAPLDVDPESFSPVPLFQGKFFRRIARLRKIDPGECISDVRLPVRPAYYGGGREQVTALPWPAARDAFMQTGALIMPPGALVESIEEIRFHAPAREGEELLCFVRASQRDGEPPAAEIALYRADGEPVETMRGVRASVPAAGTRASGARRAALPRLPEIQARLGSAVAGVPLALAVANHARLEDADARQLVPPEERGRLLAKVAEPRRASVVAGTLAARRAAAHFLRSRGDPEIDPGVILLVHGDDGKPALAAGGIGAADGLPDVSLADGAGLSFALAGAGAVGVDVEAVTARDAETWRGLLGPDGYRLALRLEGAAAEPFDCAATRVWTLLEAGKKALGLRRVVPQVEEVDGTWVRLGHPDAPGVRMVSVVYAGDVGERRPVALSIFARRAEERHA